MKYETSNIVFKKKPTEAKVKRKYPFKRHKEQVHLVEDTPHNLYLNYCRGFSMKPHPFNVGLNTLHDAQVNAIVLDFDHLTVAQKDFVESVVKGKYQFMDIYGDYSAGTKTRLYENRDIPDYINPKWGYKVFYPANCLCTWKELNEAFIKAVSFFNPLFSMEEVRETWNRWRNANNHKDKVSDPIFKDWILPDVAMLNSFRTQITYGVRPELKKDRIVKEFPKDDIYSLSLFPCGGKEDYEGLEWKQEEAVEKGVEVPDEVMEAWKSKIESSFAIEAFNVKTNPGELKMQLPTSKSMVARRLKRQKFEDLAWDEKANSILNARLYAKELNSEKALAVARESARTLTRNLLELEHQRNQSFNRGDAISMNLNAILHDTILVTRQRCGLTLFVTKEVEEPEKMKKQVVKAIVDAGQNFYRFRAKMKIRQMERLESSSLPHLETLREYVKTKDKAVLDLYNRQRREWIASILDKAINEVKMPYVYRKRGLKKWLVSVANLDLSTEELSSYGLEPVRLKEVEEWVKWCRNVLNQRDDDMNDVSDEDLARWYKDYRAEWNSKWSRLDNEGTIRKQHKQHKQHKSKYHELFEGKSREEISSMIDNMEISKQLKYKLRKLHVR